MKTLHIIFHQMFRLIRDHKGFCTLLAFAQLLGILILLFSAATIQSISVKQKEIDERSLYFEVRTMRFTDKQEKTIVAYNEVDGKKEPVYEMKNKIDLNYAYSLDDVLVRINKVFEDSTIKEQPYIYIYGKCIGHDDFTIATFLYDNNNVSNVNPGEIRLDQRRIQGYAAGDYYKLGDKKLKVKSSNDTLTTHMIVNQKDIPADWRGYNIRFCYKEAPTTEQAEKMKKLLIENFICDEMHIPETVDPLTAQFNSMAILCTFIMLIAILLNICYAQLYRFRLAKRSFAVFRLVGGNVSKICSACYSEVVFSSLTFYCIGAAIFHFQLKDKVSQWYEGADTLYTMKYYILFGCAYLAFQLILISFPLKRFINREVAVAEKEVE